MPEVASPIYPQSFHDKNGYEGKASLCHQGFYAENYQYQYEPKSVIFSLYFGR